MEIKGYKAFNKNLTNRYSKQFEEGYIYQVSGNPSFGNNGNGFHFCKRLEDTLRYFPAMNEEIDIAKVTSFGEVAEYYDDYYGYYDMFSTTIIRVDKIMTREEIIEMFLNMPEERVVRFISGYRLSEEEIKKFEMKYQKSSKILDAIAYYQEGIKDTYKRKIKSLKDS